MGRLLLAAMLAVVVFAAGTPPARAQPCVGGAWTTADMAGFYVSTPNRMALWIEPCGVMLLTWDNAYGRHRATYQAVDRFDGGGYIGAGVQHDGWFLDGQTSIGVAPAEPGWIKMLTVSPYGTDLKGYRLEKVR
jgi:hypothetical protein